MYQLLIVDDEIMIRRGLGKIIPWEQLGFQLVDIVGNAKEALEIINEKEIDVLMTDISMPEMSGLELIQLGKNKHSKLKAVIISGYSEFDYAMEAIKLKVESYILKPLDPSKIMEVFQNIKSSLDEEQSKEYYLKSEYDMHSGKKLAKKKCEDYQAELIKIFEEGRYNELLAYVEKLFKEFKEISKTDGIEEHVKEFCENALRNVVIYFHVDPYPVFKICCLKLSDCTKLEVIQCNFQEDLNLLSNCIRECSESMANLISSQVCQWVEKNYCKKELSLKSISEELGVSYGYLSTIFSKKYGESFKTYLTTIRLEKSRELLLERKYKIYEIADLVGYGSSRYFTDAFKRRYGISPVDYLNRLSKGNKE